MKRTSDTAPRSSRRLALHVLLSAGLLLSPGGASIASAQSSATRYVVSVEGLACPFCVFGLERELKGVEGVANVAVSLGESRATVDVRPGAVVRPEALRAAVREAGFTPGAITLTLTAEVRSSGSTLSVALGSDATLPIVGGSALGALRSALGAGSRRFELTATVARRGDADVLEVSAAHAR